MTKRFGMLSFAAAAAALLLAGCAASAPSDPAQPVDQTSATFVEPIEAYLAAAENDWHAAVRADLAKNQDKIATCMTNAGFEYTPSTLPPEQAPVDKSTQEWISQHGYALSPEDQQARQLEDLRDTPYGVEAPAQTAYVAALSRSERNAYLEALTGTGVNGDSGCSAAQPIDPRFTPAATKLAEDSFGYHDAAQADPKTVKAKDDWSVCMAGAGHDGLAEPVDAATFIDGLYNPVVAGGESSKPTIDRNGGEISTLSAPQVAAVRTTEIALALDDYDCQKSSKYRERTTAVLFALENAWIETHKAELDDVIAGYREASK